MPRKKQDTYFIAIDGEGANLVDGTHIYNLLAASDHTYVYNPIGISTTAAFEYLIDLKLRNPTATFVSFFFSYDVNMILGGLHPISIDHLARQGFCYVYDDRLEEKGHGYKIEYMPRKHFTLCKGRRIVTNGQRKWQTLARIKIWDVFGFFQSSFVKALKQFHIGTGNQWESLQSMKEQRSDFTTDGIDKIVEYNALECELLVDLMNDVNKSLITAGIELHSWHGAGAVAGALMRKYKVKNHIEQPTGSHINPVLSAYFGGRIQSLRIGEFNQPVYGHDLVSAYPTSIAELPSLSGMKQYTLRKYDESKRYVIYHVRWNLNEPIKPIAEKYLDTQTIDDYNGENRQAILAPFPFRDKSGNIHYPLEGEGYYWDCEVRAAKQIYGDNIQVISGYGFDITDNTKPFEFVPIMFAERKRFKQEGNNAQLVIKLGLNSLYGKTAQGIGYQGNLPPYQCYIWAGLITAETRAKMLTLAASNPHCVIGFATDGLFATEQLANDGGGDLGSWELTKYDSMFCVKPGFYSFLKNGEVLNKVRGFRLNQVNFDELRTEWNRNGIAGRIVTKNTSFIGMKSASERFKWRSWVDTEKTLTFMPTRGIPELISETPLQYRVLPPPLICPGSSKPYDSETFKNVDNLENDPDLGIDK
jgi:hypothetical protein